jgi:hypothetical protein
LDNLNASIHAFGDRQICRKNDFGEAKCAISGLIEAVDKRDVEIGGIVTAESEINKCVRPLMAAHKDQGTSVKGPFSSIGVGGGLVDSTAWKKNDSAQYLWSGTRRLVKNIHGLSHCVAYESPLQYGFLKLPSESQSKVTVEEALHDTEMSLGRGQQRQ